MACRVTKTMNTAGFTAVLHRSMYALKIANASRIHPRSLEVAAAAEAPVMCGSTSNAHRPSPIQNPPYVENAVAPKTFRFRTSHIPARSWISPPYANAKPSHASGPLVRSAFCALSKKVVSANAARPSGAGSAIGGTVRSSTTSDILSIPPVIHGAGRSMR